MSTGQSPVEGWFKSRYCGSGACVEVAIAPATVHIRDGKAPSDPHLSVSRSDWEGFVTGVKAGTFRHQ